MLKTFPISFDQVEIVIGVSEEVSVKPRETGYSYCWSFATVLKYRRNFAFLLQTNTFNQCSALEISTCLGCASIDTDACTSINLHLVAVAKWTVSSCALGLWARCA